MPTPPGYADISLRLQLTGLNRPAFITFGCDPVDTTASAVATNVVAAFSAAGSIKTIIDSAVTLTGVQVSLGTDGTADITDIQPANVACSYVGSTLPPNCAMLVRKNTGRGGRRGRGRMFIPWCLPEGNVEEWGTIQSSIVTANQNACNTFFNQLASFLVPMVLLHGPGQTSAPAPDLVTNLVVDPLVSTQRRRLGR